MTTQQDKADAFQALHQRDGAFLIPNPWDAGTTKMLTALGYEAVATTSFGVANTLGCIDGTRAVTRQDVLDNCKVVADATHLPVNADLENCFADAPEDAANMITDAAEAGMVGGSIEDATGDRANPIYDFALTVERVHAAVEAAATLPFKFMLTARAENHLHGRNDLDDTIRRLQAFEEAGADVLYAPGLKDLDTMKTVVSAVSKPVNIVMGFADPTITVAQLEEIGVKRISIGGALSRYALGAFLKGAREMLEDGRFTFVGDAVPGKELWDLFRK